MRQSAAEGPWDALAFVARAQSTGGGDLSLGLDGDEGKDKGGRGSWSVWGTNGSVSGSGTGTGPGSGK